MFQKHLCLLICIVVLTTGCRQPTPKPRVIPGPWDSPASAPATEPADAALSITLSDELLPPLSASAAGLRSAVTVTISKGHLMVEEKEIARIKNGEVDSSVKRDGASGYLITPLMMELQRQAVRIRKLEKTTRGKMTFEGLVTVVVHRTTPYRLLSEVLYTAGQAEFGTYQLYTLRHGGKGLAEGCVRVEAPRYDATAAGSLGSPGDRPRLNLTIAISYKGFVVANSGGVVKGADGSHIAVPCKQMENARCTWDTTVANKASTRWSDGYDHAGLLKLVKETKAKFPGERQVIVTADRQVPVQVVVRALDTLRGTATVGCTGKDGCLFDRPVLSAGVQ